MEVEGVPPFIMILPSPNGTMHSSSFLLKEMMDRSMTAANLEGLRSGNGPGDVLLGTSNSRKRWFPMREMRGNG